MNTLHSPVSGRTRNSAEQSQGTDAGFSQVDLLTVIGVLVVLGLLLTPALARTVVTDQAVQCRNNLRQLLNAWRMYAEDNNGTLPANHDGGITHGSWANGWEDFTSNNTGNTNLLYLANALLGPYVSRQTALFKCPADVSMCQEWGRPMPRVRSISMNMFVEGNAYQGQKSNPQGAYWFQTYRAYTKLSDMIQPVPSDLIVFADEHPDSINDCWLITDVTSPNTWLDLPASYHGNACGMAFADGHSTTHRWLNGSTAQPILRIQRNSFPVPPGSADLQWMFQHVSALLP